MLVDGLGLMPLTRNLLLSELNSMPYPGAMFSGLSVSYCSSSSLPPSTSISSANLKSQSRSPMHDEVSKLSTLSFPGLYLIVLEIVDVHAVHPCTVVGKKSPTVPFSNTALVGSSYNNQQVVDVVFF